ncbi:MAG: PSP1 domain-containing protein [Flavobacteriales bacterium]
MSCTNCKKGEDGNPRGCKSNGNCGTGGCGPLTVFDWLEGVALPTGQTAFDIVEVRFKSNRKGFFRRSGGIEVQVGDVVVLDAEVGWDIGVVSLRGELVRVQMKAKKVKDDHEIKKIIRKAAQEDIDSWQNARMRETETVTKSREIIRNLGLHMKLSDVEFQGDAKKATFYYIAEERVDFRELVRDLAGAFAVRVEMRQIGARQEAARVGGIGVCGRELCCSSWLTDFRSVSTSAARYQQLSLNPQKLAGQCGKLKCCLNYELDQYVESVKEFPSPNTKIKLKEGRAVVFKMDIFKSLVYLLQLDAPSSSPVPVTLEDMKELMAMNERGEYPKSLSEFALEEEPTEVDAVYSNVVGQDSLTRFDEERRRNKKNRGKSGGGNNRRGRPQGNAPGSAANKPSGDQRKSPSGNEKSPRGKRKDGDKPRQGRQGPPPSKSTNQG